MANNNNVKGTDKVLQKLKESVDNANYYEAHQMYRTVCRRYIKQKKYSNAAELLFSGAQTLLKHRQGGSGTDLALYMIEAYNEEQLPVTDESRSRIIQLLELFPPNEIGRKKFIDAAVSWSVKFGESPAGDPELHHYVGELFWKDKSYPEAEPHFLAGTSESSKSYGKMLAEWSEKDQFDKSGLYIARAVLQYLCLRSIKDAKISFDTFVSSKQQQQSNDIKKGVAEYRPTITGDPIEIPIYSLPLLNFLQLLILTVQRDAADLFVSLKNKYKSVLSIDQSENLLNKIGDVFFNIKPQRPQQFNVFQDLMNNLFQGPMMGGGGGGGGGRFGGSSSSASQSNSHSRINSSSELD